MSQKKKSSVPLQPPNYRGGKKAMIEFIEKNLRYPEEALRHQIEGSVKVEFVVDGRGKVIETRILEGIGYGCDEEAIRLVELMAFEKVYNRGLNTRTRRGITIHFKLPEKKSVQLNYQLVQSKKSPPSSRKSTYNIRVNLPPDKD